MSVAMHTTCYTCGTRTCCSASVDCSGLAPRMLDAVEPGWMKRARTTTFIHRIVSQKHEHNNLCEVRCNSFGIRLHYFIWNNDRKRFFADLRHKCSRWRHGYFRNVSSQNLCSRRGTDKKEGSMIENELCPRLEWCIVITFRHSLDRPPILFASIGKSHERISAASLSNTFTSSILWVRLIWYDCISK